MIVVRLCLFVVWFGSISFSHMKLRIGFLVFFLLLLSGLQVPSLELLLPSGLQVPFRTCSSVVLGPLLRSVVALGPTLPNRRSTSSDMSVNSDIAGAIERVGGSSACSLGDPVYAGEGVPEQRGV